MGSHGYQVGVLLVALALVLAGGPALVPAGGPALATSVPTEQRHDAPQPTATASQSADAAAQETTTARATTVQQDDETDNESITAEELLREAEAAYEGYDSFTARQITTATVDGNASNATARVFYERPDRTRIEYLGPSPQAGTVVVSNGSQALIYNATNNTVQRFDQPRLAGTGGGFFDSIVRSLRGLNTTYRGTETVEGRETYVLTAQSSERPGPNVSQTFYLDAETYFPVQQRSAVTLTQDGETIETDTTTVYANVTLNPDLPADTFDFTPPAGATVVESAIAVDTYDSVAAAQETVAFRIREPGYLPAGYEFDRTAVFRFGDASNVILNYVDESGVALTVTQTDLPDAANATGENATETVGFGEPISFDGRNGTLAAFGTDRTLVFDCAGQQISVSGRLNRSELVRVAASISCVQAQETAPDPETTTAEPEETTPAPELEETTPVPESADPVFTEPFSIERGGLTVSVGPPRDPDGDGAYEDVNGDGRVGPLDATLHSLVVSAVEANRLSLTEAQRDALDVNGDGVLDYEDAVAILRDE